MPSAAGRSQAVPYGPWTPTTSPGRLPHSAAVTAPTARMVCTYPAGRARPLIDTGTSPTPGAYSMANCPGRNLGQEPSIGCSARVTVSMRSSRRDRTRYGAGVIKHRSGAASPGEGLSPQRSGITAHDDGIRGPGFTTHASGWTAR
jgi:hypothetical protein